MSYDLWMIQFDFIWIHMICLRFYMISNDVYWFHKIYLLDFKLFRLVVHDFVRCVEKISFDFTRVRKIVFWLMLIPFVFAWFRKRIICYMNPYEFVVKDFVRFHTIVCFHDFIKCLRISKHFTWFRKIV